MPTAVDRGTGAHRTRKLAAAARGARAATTASARATARRPAQGDSPRALIAWTIGVVALAVVLLWTLYLCRHVLVVVYVSILLAAGMSPMVRWLERQRMLTIGGRLPRWLAIGVLYTGIVGALLLVGLAVVPMIVTQSRELLTALPALVDDLEGFFGARGIALQVPASLGEALRQADFDGAASVGTTMLSTMVGVVGGVFGAATILILTFYLLIDSRALLRNLIRMVPERRRPDAEAVTHEVVLKTSAWLSGQLLLAGIIGATTALALGLLGVPYFWVVAVIAAVVECLPYVGPLLAAAVGVSIALSTSGEMAIAVAVFFFLQQQLENHVLVPKLMERQVGLSPAFVIIALMIGGALLGIVGMLLAVPTAAIVQVVVDELRGDGAPSSEGPARA